MDPLLLRFIERITAVLIGGLAIYLGYRLFRSVPQQRNSAGKLILPWDISIVMTRVGPGVFFALFGVVAVALALLRPLEVGLQGVRRYMGGSASDDRSARADGRALLRRDIAVLNTIPRLLRANLAEHEQDSIRRGIARAKLQLMKPVWGEPAEGFGEISKFEEWVQAGEPDPPPAGMEGALTLFRYGGAGP